ncbi:MAG TPA: carbamoyltransferase HypF [Planosporangium sp.]|nr:carbamoyltransferase HypF [Planosporangium sp.]
MTGENGRVRHRIRVEGIVQGVGFRPFVYALATRYGLTGVVGNDARGVFIEVEGLASGVTTFQREVVSEAPPLAVVERVSVRPIAPTGASAFVMAPSEPGGERQTLISPDMATCADCLRELFDPADRRYRYPFINCTNCGPRFTIIRDVPYDRPATTMAGFPLCTECAREYADPADRRFHAQPVCCPACGPRLSVVAADGTAVDGDPIAATADLLRAGRVVAVKGLGGYHLAADAACDAAVGALRSRKHREDKAFAVMVADLAAARRLCLVDEAEEALLAGPRRPVVLLRRHAGARIAAAVAPGNSYLGLMLPYTPLHHLLVEEFPGPFVLTSGNVSDEPIAYVDDDAGTRLAGIADAFLRHDRPIHIRADDSVVRVVAGRPLVLRRSRGYAPQPLRLARPVPRPVLGCGAELKNTFCLAKGSYAFMSAHIGDLENYPTLRSYTEGVAHLRRLFDVDPAVVAHDLHPEYLSTKYALDLTGVALVGVQHHHAHIASCLVDNDSDGPAIGVAFDGLGYGTDATIWGGEFLVCDLTGFERAGWLEPVAMPGATAAIRQPWRMAAAYLDVAYAGDIPPDLAVRERNADRWDTVVALGRSGLNSPVTSSAGRLFDAVAALAGVRDSINYEGQAAVELERRIDPAAAGSYPAGVTDGYPFRIRGADLVRAAAEDVRAGVPVSTIATRCHRGVADLILAGARRVRAATGLSTVALSGGVFQNVVLLEATVPGLEAHGFRVLTHHRVPPNDGGISLGQVAVAAARERTGTS